MNKVAVVIPAFNEGQRVASVLRAVKTCKSIHEIIVVDDGSTDNTSKVASEIEGVKVVTLAKNVGKGGAMHAGVLQTSCPIILFVDADLAGLTAEHLEQILAPILRGECDMSVGVFRGGKIGSNAGMAISPFLSGQRALKRDFFLGIPSINDLRYGVEMAITEHARRRKITTRRVTLRGVSNTLKEEKLGLVKGIQARTKMYREIREAMVRSRKKKRSQRKRWLDL
jgi:glycosyltransferase involved in cell wall biosynthesis